jgi:signal transduction histidine kinase/ActR/RegA family two-component response regulator
MSNSKHYLLAVGFATAMLLFAGVSWLEWQNARDEEATNDFVALTHEVQAELNRVLSLVNDIESAQRGYIITSNPEFIATIDEEIRDIQAQIAQLNQIVIDPQQRRDLPLLEKLVDERIKLVRQTLDLHQTSGFEAARAAIAGGAGKIAMQQVQEHHRKMSERQSALLAERSRANATEQAQVLRMEITGAIVGFLLLITIIGVALRENALRQRTIVALNEHQAQLKAAKEDAEHADAAKSTFLATVSHEIRTPLNGLLGMLELLSLTKLDAQQAETLEIARDSARGMGRIINDILDQAKIAAGKLEILPEPMSIAQLLPRLINIYHAVASGKSLVLRQMTDPRISPLVMADSLRLLQILGNFVSNALKFTEKGYVEVRAEFIERKEDREVICFSVKDTGIGISPDTQKTIFEPFVQATASTARLYGGTGLGLSISRRLVEMMGGNIHIESALGVGTTVSMTLTFPIATATQPHAAAEVPARNEPRLYVDRPKLAPSRVDYSAYANQRVLAVDDHPVNRLLLERQLAQFGLRVTSALDGRDALDAWRTGHHALVITDCNMPEMDGYELARAIREAEAKEHLARTPIIGWTANAAQEVIGECRAAGMDDVLIKPANLEALRQLVSKWLATTPPTV